MRALLAKYNPRKNIWVAYDKFNTECLPYMVNVVPHYRQEPVGSRTSLNRSYSILEEAIRDNAPTVTTLSEQLNTLLAQGEAAYNSGNEAGIPYNEIRSVVAQMSAVMGFTSQPPTEPVEFEQLQKEVDDVLGNFSSDNYYAFMNKNLNELGTLVEDFEFGTADGLTEASLTADGYEKIKVNDGTTFFVRPADDGSWSCVDFGRNLKVSFKPKADDTPREQPISPEMRQRSVEKDDEG